MTATPDCATSCLPESVGEVGGSGASSKTCPWRPASPQTRWSGISKLWFIVRVHNSTHIPSLEAVAGGSYTMFT